MNQSEKSIKDYVNWQIQRIIQSSNESVVRADLAKLRRGIGKKPGEMPELWAYTLEELPEEFLSRTGEPTHGEWAVYTALTLYSLHQQSLPLKDYCMSQNKSTFAEAVAGLIENEDGLKKVKHRFDSVTTSYDMTELAYHARGLIQLLRREKIALDYPRFAQDLYLYQFLSYRDSVRLKWGQDFYRAYGRKFSAKKDA